MVYYAIFFRAYDRHDTPKQVDAIYLSWEAAYQAHRLLILKYFDAWISEVKISGAFEYPPEGKHSF